MDICLLNVNINVSINDNSFKYICVVCYIKLSFYCLTCSAMPNLNSANFTTQNSQSSEEILILKRETLPEFQNKTNIKIIGFKLMHLGFALVLSDIDLRNRNLLDTHLDLLDTDIPRKPFLSLQDALEKSSRHAFKTSSS